MEIEKSKKIRNRDPRWSHLVAFLVDVRAISFDSYIDYWMKAYDYDKSKCPDLKAHMKGLN
jgi:hypothetical protein